MRRSTPMGGRSLVSATPKSVLALLVLGLAALLAFTVSAGRASGPGEIAMRWLYPAVFLMAALAVLIRATRGGPERTPWLVFGVGLLLNCAGWVYYLFVLADAETVSIPSVSDVLWLSAYTLDYLALVLLMRARAPRFPRSLWLDGAIGACGLGALSSTFLYGPIIEGTGGSAAAVIVGLAYPIVDLVTLSLVVFVMAMSGWRPGRSWLVICLAFSIQVVIDSIYAYQSAKGTWDPESVLSVGWAAAVLLLAAGAWTPARRHRVKFEGWRMMALPGAFFAIATAVLVHGSLAPDSATPAAILAGTALALVAVRGGFTFREMLRLAERHARAVDASLTDNLTGLRNHRAFHEDLSRAQAGGGHGPAALLMVDLVGLKMTNDTLGHQAGDERLKRLAVGVAEVVRKQDAAYRIGGDEFALLLPGLSAWEGFNVAERLQHALSGGFRGVAPAISIGVAESEPGIHKDELVRRADAALVSAKRAHRKTVVWTESLNELAPAGPTMMLPPEYTRTLATALARAVDAKDSYTRSHCETVSELCVRTASGLGLAAERVEKLRLAGLLHDVGKIGVPDAVLQKPAPLDDDEFELMKAHSTLGHTIVSGAGLDQEAEWVRHHHERPDGSGYPDGLSGDDIPLESRIILVADAYEAITSDRPYRKGGSQADALAELRAYAGSQFDPACVEALASALGERPAPLPTPAG